MCIVLEYLDYATKMYSHKNIFTLQTTKILNCQY